MLKHSNENLYLFEYGQEGNGVKDDSKASRIPA